VIGAAPPNVFATRAPPAGRDSFLCARDHVRGVLHLRLSASERWNGDAARRSPVTSACTLFASPNSGRPTAFSMCLQPQIDRVCDISRLRRAADRRNDAQARISGPSAEPVFGDRVSVHRWAVESARTALGRSSSFSGGASISLASNLAPLAAPARPWHRCRLRPRRRKR